MGSPGYLVSVAPAPACSVMVEQEAVEATEVAAEMAVEMAAVGAEAAVNKKLKLQEVVWN